MISFGENELSTFLVVLARASAWAFTSPVIGERAVPARIRMMAAVLFSLAVLPVRTPVPSDSLFTVLPVELCFGLMLGLSSRLVLAGAEAGGQLIGIQLGLGFAGTFDPDAQDESIATRKIAYFLAGLAFLHAGGLETAIRALTVAAVPPGALTDTLAVLIKEAPKVLVHAVRIAAPLIIASFVANIAVALASRASPGLNVFSVMLALFLALGGLVLLGTSPDFAREMSSAGSLARDAIDRTIAR